MKTEVQAVIGLSASGTEDTLLQGWLNDGVVDVLVRTGCYVTSATMTETAGTGDYTLDSAILDTKSLRWSSADGSTQSYPERVPMAEIERLRSSSDTTSSSYPAAYYAVTGTTLSVWPTPSATDTITIWYTPLPTAMSQASHDPSNATYGGVPVEYHKAIVLYAEWKAGDYRDDQSSEQGERYRTLYEGNDGRGGIIARIRGQVYRKGGRPGRAILHPSRRRFPVENDRY